MTIQLDRFGEPATQSTAPAAVLVRSHMRHVKGRTAPRQDPQDYIEQARQEDIRRANSRDTGLLVTAPHNGSHTSRAASRAVTQSGQQATQLAQVLRIITKAGERGTTRADIAHAMNIERAKKLLSAIPQSTVCARVNRLMKEGSVVEAETPRLPDCGGSIRQKVLVRAV